MLLLRFYLRSLCELKTRNKIAFVWFSKVCVCLFVKRARGLIRGHVLKTKIRGDNWQIKISNLTLHNANRKKVVKLGSKQNKYCSSSIMYFEQFAPAWPIFTNFIQQKHVIKNVYQFNVDCVFNFTIVKKRHKLQSHLK